MRSRIQDLGNTWDSSKNTGIKILLKNFASLYKFCSGTVEKEKEIRVTLLISWSFVGGKVTLQVSEYHLDTLLGFDWYSFEVQEPWLIMGPGLHWSNCRYAMSL